MSVMPIKWAEVDVAALRANVEALCAHAGSASVMAMIKANGYGHGALLAAQAALDGGARWLGVSSAEEALQLREAGIEAPLLIVGWSHPANLRCLVEATVDVAVYDVESVERIAGAARDAGRIARVHVKIDSGMGRLGVRADDVGELAGALSAGRDRVRVTGVFTHFADADGSEAAFTEEQHERFLQLAEGFLELAPDALLHCANSAATLRLPQFHHDMVRPGIALYGYPPAVARDVLALSPVMTMVATVTQVKTVRAGDTVGYGRTWRAKRDTRIATVAAGYADGVQRTQSNRGQVLIHGRRCPIVGRVSMDQLTADVSALDSAAAGDEAVLFGTRDGVRLGADEAAAAVGTIPYEVLCGVSARVPRHIVGASSESPSL